MKKCSQCGEIKEEGSFGWARGSDKKPGVRRAKCRPCYNLVRREHYSREDVKAEKIRIRREYESRPEVREKKNAAKRTPEAKAKAAAALKKYKSRPEIKEYLRQKKLDDHKKPSFRAARLMVSVIMRCRKKNLPIGIDVGWIEKALEKGVCQVSGLPFDFGKHPTTLRNPFSPSIDQIVAGKGYTLENSRVVLTAVNLALCEWGVDTYLQIAQGVLRVNGFSVVKMEGTCEQSLQLP